MPPQKKSAKPFRSRRRRALVLALVVLLLGVAIGYGTWYFAAGRYSRVPGVRGATEQSALQKLRSAGYQTSVRLGPQFDDTVAKGRVLRTAPASATRAVRGTRVVLVLSAGPHYYQVKSVVGSDPDVARQSLASVGPLTVAQQVRPEASDTVPAGKVTRTDPTAGARVTGHHTITIYVSTGPPIIDVPSIAQGTAVSAARSTLKKAHFKVSVVQEYSDTVAADQVITSTPTGQARKFSTVTLTVSRGPQLVTVPDVAAGASVADASRALDAVGLKADVRPFLGEAGTPTTVLGLSPHSGTSVHAGSTVVVYAVSG